MSAHETRAADVDRLAREFSRVVREWLTPSELRKVVKRNVTPEYLGSCATHDFCDANMAMDEAYRAAFDTEMDVGIEAVAHVVNEAWDRAKASGFTLGAARGPDETAHYRSES